MISNVSFSLSYDGNDAEDHEIDFYDMAQALIGFQRSLALTTHLILNGEVITKATALQGAKIHALPSEAGSWKATAVVGFLLTGAYHLGTAPKDTPLGNMVSSAYDYVISETLGFHVDYEKTLGQQYEELKKSNSALPALDQSRMDSLIEKCEPNILQMHRPIAFSETATHARITSTIGRHSSPFRAPLNRSTFEYISITDQSDDTDEVVGRISSYNINTFKGRIFVLDEKRPIPFILAESSRGARSITRITRSLGMNALDRFREDANVRFVAYKNLSRTGRLKFLYVIEVR